ncbi:nucleotidyltransferase domain-containing protein [Moorella naiadis]|uniref:type VII toxin-antitoxin system MntA family adenylyltransferase antitoxin n=1 Tax=Moorella naiadis (nom. illeg.) TaxID=3093670 RepID=UPI003D9CB7E1
MDPAISSLVERLRDGFIKRNEIEFAYLFGSHARGTANNLSDVDVAIFLKESLMPPAGPYGYKSELLVSMRQQLRLPVDIVILNETSRSLRFRVIRDGKILFCRNNKARVHFHEKTLRDYLDFRPAQKIQQQYLLRRLASGHFGGGLSG